VEPRSRAATIQSVLSARNDERTWTTSIPSARQRDSSRSTFGFTFA
jgi:hypothetical protein